MRGASDEIVLSFVYGPNTIILDTIHTKLHTLIRFSHTKTVTHISLSLPKVRNFLPREAMLSAVYASSCVCLCVCLTYSGIVSKRLNVGSRK